MHPRGEVSPRTKAYRLRDSEIGLPHVLSRESAAMPGNGQRRPARAGQRRHLAPVVTWMFAQRLAGHSAARYALSVAIGKDY